MSRRARSRFGWVGLAIVAGIAVFGFWRATRTHADEEPGGPPVVSEPPESENSDGCESIWTYTPGGGGNDPCDRFNPGSDHESPEAPEGGDDPESPPAGEAEAGAGGDGKHAEGGNGSLESRPDPEGSGDGGGDGETTDPGSIKQAGDRDASEGSSGDAGGPEEGDGESDRKGGECDGKIVLERVDSSATGSTPKPVNPFPLGGAMGNNPGFLNAPVVFRYRGFSTTDGPLGLGVDANILERLVVAPQRNPSAALAWYPGTGACHYFFGSAGGPYAPEPAIQDTHQPIVVDPNSTSLRYRLTDKYGNTTYFDATGWVTKKVDRLGNTNLYGRNPATGQLLTISSSYGHASLWTFEYYPSGRLKWATDYSGRRNTWTYDSLGHLATFTTPPTTQHPSGKTFQLEYYANSGNPGADGKLKRIVDPTGVTRVQFGYDAQGYATSLSRGNGMHQLTLTRNGNTRDVTDFNGNLRRYTFQPGLHHPTQVELFTRGLRPNDPASYVWTYEFNPQRQLTRAGMPSGKTYEFTFDANFNRTRRRVIGVGGSQTADWTWTYGAFNLASTVTDPNGNTWTYGRDANGLVTTVTTPNPGSGAAQYRYEYNAYGQLQKSTNSLGRTVTYGRYGAGPYYGWVQSVTYSQEGGGNPGTCGSGQVYTYTYNLRGFPLTVTDPATGTVTLERDEVDRVTKVSTSAPVPFVRKMSFNVLGLPVLVQTENRADDGTLDATKPWISTSILYDARRRVTGISQDFDATTGRSWTFERDGLARVLQETSPEGRISQFTHDERGYLLSSSRGVTQPIASTVAYHVGGAVKEVKNAFGHAVTTGVDVFDRLISSTSPTGESRLRGLDSSGNTLTEELRDSSNVLYGKVTYTYDNRNRVLTRKADRFGHGGPTEYAIAAYAYDLDSNVVNVLTPLGRSYTHAYLSCGKPFSDRDDQTSGIVEYTYEERGLLSRTRRTETEGGTTKVYTREYSYDLNGQLVQEREIDANNSSNVLTTSYSRDSHGRVATVTGPSGEYVRYVYNYAGLVTDVFQQERVSGTPNVVQHHTVYAWDRDGNLLSVTDPTGAKTEYEYSEHGLLKKVKQPDGTSTSWTFDVAGRVATITDNIGTVVTNAYDAAGRLTGRTINRGTNVIGTTAESFTYDAVGRLIRAADDDSVVDFTYDSLGNVLTDKQGPTPAQLLTVQGGYDVEGNPTSLTYPNGFQVGLTIDAAGRFHKVMSGGNVLLERTYVQTSFLAQQLTAGATSVDNWSHDGFGRLSIAEVKRAFGGGGPVTLSDLEYGYDPSHRRIYERRRHANNVGDLHTYDDLGRSRRVLQGVADPVLELQTPGSQTYSTNVAYTLDPVGARTTVSRTPWGGTPTTTSYTSNNLHQYTAVGGTGRSYDLNGNLTNDGTFLFRYDYRNRIVEVRRFSDNSFVAGYEYDAFGRRFAKHVPGASTRYYHWGQNVVEVRDMSGAVSHQFVSPDGLDDHALLIRLDTADWDQDGNVNEYLMFTYHTDPLGSIRLVTDVAGATVETYSYDE